MEKVIKQMCTNQMHELIELLKDSLPVFPCCLLPSGSFERRRLSQAQHLFSLIRVLLWLQRQSENMHLVMDLRFGIADICCRREQWAL